MRSFADCKLVKLKVVFFKRGLDCEFRNQLLTTDNTNPESLSLARHPYECVCDQIKDSSNKSNQKYSYLTVICTRTKMCSEGILLAV